MAAKRLREHLYTLFMETERVGTPSLVFDMLMTVVLCLSVGGIIIETVPGIAATYRTEIDRVDAITMSLITVDYLARLILCVDDPIYGGHGPIMGRLRFSVTPLALVDIISIAPYYCALFGLIDLRFLLALRLLRVLKLARYSPALTSVLAAIIAERRALMASLFLFLVALVLVSGCMYRIEGDIQPKIFGSIPRAMWWAVVTLTTVGYGDVVPVTGAGRAFAGVTAMLGIMLTAIPSGIMASSFITELKKRDFVVSCRLVGRVPFFRGLEPELIAEIAAVLKARVFPPHYVLMHKGDRGDRIYFLVEGEARVELPDSTAMLSTGDFFGEMALLYDEKRKATVVTATECRVLYLDRDHFLNLLDTHPRMRSTVERTAARRVGHAPTLLRHPEHDHPSRSTPPHAPVHGPHHDTGEEPETRYRLYPHHIPEPYTGAFPDSLSDPDSPEET